MGSAFALLADVGPDRESCETIVATLEDKLAAIGRRPASGRSQARGRGGGVHVRQDQGGIRLPLSAARRWSRCRNPRPSADLLDFIIRTARRRGGLEFRRTPRFRESLAAEPAELQFGSMATPSWTSRWPRRIARTGGRHRPDAAIGTAARTPAGTKEP